MDKGEALADKMGMPGDEVENYDQALRDEHDKRVRAELEIEQLRQQLVDAWRQAGMADVTAGVLHNVGNVLNSVNVSATLITEKLQQSRSGNLFRAIKLLEGHEGSLAEFLANDPKGRLIPEYFAEVSAHIAREREEVLGELELLAKNIEHIKSIIRTQQSYARVSGMREQVAVDGLVEDALRLNAGGFERHGIVVVRDYAETPQVLVDKHEALQIIVNIIRNAKNAMDEASTADKRLTIAIKRNDRGLIEVAFTDTGVGISEENLTRIFSRGFTTRPHGRGIGLHSAELAARKMGGRLYATSEGLGKGATFILELPPAGISGKGTRPS